MKTFRDVNGCVVHYTYERQPFAAEPDHALIILHCPAGWVLTRHKVRGLEFPGGKREAGETIEDTARREAFEETGAVPDKIHYIGQYKVISPDEEFVKDVYFANTGIPEETAHYHETDGPAILPVLPDDFSSSTFSFIMKDQVMTLSLERIKDLALIEND